MTLVDRLSPRFHDTPVPDPDPRRRFRCQRCGRKPPSRVEAVDEDCGRSYGVARKFLIQGWVVLRLADDRHWAGARHEDVKYRPNDLTGGGPPCKPPSSRRALPGGVRRPAEHFRCAFNRNTT